MGINTEVVDRQPKFPGRVYLAPVSGQANVYDMVRADQPVKEGTPIDKALLDQKAYTLTKNVTLYVSPSGNDTTGKGTSTAPYKTINKALSTIPKNLGGFIASVNIADGVYDEVVYVDWFHGGTVRFVGETVSTVSVKHLGASSARLEINDITLEIAGGETVGISISRGALLVANTPVIIANTGSGLYAQTGSTAIFNSILTISNCTSAAVRIGSMANVYASHVAGSDNALGISADTGALFCYGASDLTAATAMRTANGGRILSGPQVSIPNY